MFFPAYIKQYVFKCRECDSNLSLLDGKKCASRSIYQRIFAIHKSVRYEKAKADELISLVLRSSTVKKMILDTPRLFLREMNEKDYDALYLVLADSDIMKHYPYIFDEKRVKGWIEKNIERYRVFGYGLWAVCLKETEEMIGDCGLTMQNINGTVCPEIGYHIRRDCQRKGYAKEAASAVRDWTFKNTQFNVVYSYMKKDNIASVATAKAIGMHKSDEYVDAEQEITSVYSLERSRS